MSEIDTKPFPRLALIAAGVLVAGSIAAAAADHACSPTSGASDRTTPVESGSDESDAIVPPTKAR